VHHTSLAEHNNHVLRDLLNSLKQKWLICINQVQSSKSNDTEEAIVSNPIKVFWQPG
jgi:hypothetical protein